MVSEGQDDYAHHGKDARRSSFLDEAFFVKPFGNVTAPLLFQVRQAASSVIILDRVNSLHRHRAEILEVLDVDGAAVLLSLFHPVDPPGRFLGNVLGSNV